MYPDNWPKCRCGAPCMDGKDTCGNVACKLVRLDSLELGCKAESLTRGTTYDVTSLRLIGWTNGDGSGHEGYHAADYFDSHGAYLGPDQHGIEPLFAAGLQRGRIASGLRLEFGE